MSNYNPKSLKAEEFISHEEILETIEYAEKNKHNVELIDQILNKARPQKTEHGVHCEGLTHREASVLLACDIPEKVEEMYKLANEIKQAFYGNRIVMFAPLYLSNYCVNGCVYDSIKALNTKDAVLAQSVIDTDDIVDTAFNNAKQTLIDKFSKDANVEYALNLLMVAKYFEKIGDHAVNIAQWAMYDATGKL